MRYRVERALATDDDLAAIFDFLLLSYLDFGDARDEALARAAARIEGIEAEMLALGATPHQGTLRPELLPGLRSVTKRRAIFYFDVDDDLRLVRVLAIFFGGQDHQRAMLQRLSKSD
ncbi:MAG: type II toxin-antitoxin system RelE/ParE family toxin [Alphaproteobacteria bacterium]|nr:type II toxin-antitoxin system RelE/ParE family toxin [Alphaproteobacteria bacterium]